MKKHLILAVALVAAILSACSSDDGVMTKNGDTYIVNTTSIAADVIGFKGTTPLLVHIENDIVVKVEPLENIETPRYFRDVEDSLLGVWIGMPVKEVAESDFDAVSGATFSSDAVIANVKRAVKYYIEHK